MCLLISGFAVFAKTEIPSKTFVCVYPGDILPTEQFDHEVQQGIRREIENYIYTFRENGVDYW